MSNSDSSRLWSISDYVELSYHQQTLHCIYITQKSMTMLTNKICFGVECILLCELKTKSNICEQMWLLTVPSVLLLVKFATMLICDREVGQTNYLFMRPAACSFSQTNNLCSFCQLIWQSCEAKKVWLHDVWDGLPMLVTSCWAGSTTSNIWNCVFNIFKML